MQQWLPLLVLVGLVQSFDNLCLARSRGTKNEHRMPHSQQLLQLYNLEDKAVFCL